MFYAIRDLSRLLSRRFEAAAQEHGLTLPQWRALATLYKQGGLSQSALAQSIESDPMTVSGLLERLEAKGLVERKPDPQDSRAKIASITDTAQALIDDMHKVADDLFDQAFDGIDEKDRQAAMNVLERLQTNLNLASQATPKETA